jgi:hypothetical protein
MKKNLLIFIHLILTALAFTCWFWCDWRAITVLAIAHLVMLEIMHGCPLTHAQFSGDKDTYFYEWWMKKLGVKFTKKSRHITFLFMRYVLPFVIIGLAILLQVVINVKPLIILPF